MQNFQWISPKKTNTEKVKYLSKQLGNINPILIELLLQKGIENFEQAQNFFCPNLKKLHNPFEMKGMEKSVKRIATSLQKNEKILVYGDYDVDGTTAVSIVYSFLKEHNENIAYYIPDRYTEGYGISKQVIDFVSENNFNLVISLDCGIKANEQIDYANSKNIDFIICDHHTPSKNIPKALAVLNPKQKDCNYPYKELSGCGIGFKLIQALCEIMNLPNDKVYQYLDLTALSIGADIVPITGENRILAYFGLQEIAKKKRLSLKKLLQNKSEYSISDLVFSAAPQINAAGRIKHAKYAVKLLTETKEKKIEQLILDIKAFNEDRKNKDHIATKEALEILKTEPKNRKTNVIHNSNWSKGIVGIVASRIIENHYLPTIIFTEKDGVLIGSGRSIEGIDLYSAVNSCSEFIEQFGGHIQAVGISIKKENFDNFKQKFENEISKKYTDDVFIPKIEISAKITLKDLTPKFYNTLKRMSPFGPKNMNPIFLIRGLNDIGMAKTIGKNNEHLKLCCHYPHQNSQQYFDIIGFKMGKFYELTKDKKPFDAIFTIEKNEFMGNSKLQLVLKDLKKA